MKIHIYMNLVFHISEDGSELDAFLKVDYKDKRYKLSQNEYFVLARGCQSSMARRAVKRPEDASLNVAQININIVLNILLKPLAGISMDRRSLLRKA